MAFTMSVQSSFVSLHVLPEKKYQYVFLLHHLQQLDLSPPFFLSLCMFLLVIIQLNTLFSVSQEYVPEILNGNAPGVSSLRPGELFDVELSKKDSSLGLSVTVLFDKVFTLSLFCPLSSSPYHRHPFECACRWVWFA